MKFNGLVKINGRCIILGDGIKVGKEGRKMPGVKWLHQQSESNSKAEYIMGHSVQAVSIVAKVLSTYSSRYLQEILNEKNRFKLSTMQQFKQ